jgi:hypothetical protein
MVHERGGGWPIEDFYVNGYRILEPSLDEI